MASIDLAGLREALADRGRRRLAAWIAPLALVAAAAYAPLLAEFFQTLWAREYYQHFPFVLAAFAWLLGSRAWEAREAIERHAGRRPAVTLALAAAAWALLALAYAAPSPWLAYLSLILLAAAAIAALGGGAAISGAWAAWALLWLVLPPPLNRDQALITLLQRVSSRASSFVLDAWGVRHLMEGNTLLLPDKQFFVDEACSGIISVMSIIACAAIYGVWLRRSLLHVALLAVLGVGWATLMNTLRISAIAIVYDGWGIDWSVGTPHEVLSLCVFTVTFLALVSTDVLLAGLLAPIGPTWDAIHADPVRWGRPLVRLWDRLQGAAGGAEGAGEEGEESEYEYEYEQEHDYDREGEAERVPVAPRVAGAALAPPRRPGGAWLAGALAAAFVALPGWHWSQAAWGDAPPEARPLDSAEVDAVIDRALARDESALPAELAGAQREAFSAQERDRDDLMGAYSRSFEYRDERGTLYLVSCDFPYEGGWHELTVCYRGVGWTLEERTIAESDAEQGWPRMEASFTKPGGVQAFLTVCGFDETGTAIPLPTMSLWEDAWRALTQRETRSHRVAFQVQVFTTSGDEIDERTRDTARALLLAARQLLREQIIERGAAEAAADDQATTAGAERDEAATDEGAPRTGADQP